MSQTLKSNPEFEAAYQLLNVEQKKAVDSIEGPLMVIAGPGTGKTQILAVRIGNILLNTDTDPKNILCLTYTEAGATAMRQRLIKFIGPTAYEVSISTFHSFCNSVIRENSEHFLHYSDYEVLSDLEKFQTLLKILEALDRNDIHYKYNGNYQNDFWALSDFFSLIKKENWNPNQIISDIETFIETEKEDSKYIYKRKSGSNKPGDFKQNDFNKFLKSIERTKSAISLYKKYQEELDLMQRYEYEDMIRWVIEKFDSDDSLLAKYQERFQYILVDEYQDTNGAQNKILFQLLSYFEKPNAFAVGDDDQAIYRFQGANVQNMFDFESLYSPKKIVLANNYRSSQLILDTADHVIRNNQERLINKDTSLHKNLVASGDTKKINLRPQFTTYLDLKSEVLHICEQVQTLILQGTPANEIAILFRKNKEAESFIKWFEAEKIPYQTNKQVNILESLFLQHVLNILRFLSKEFQNPGTQDVLLYKILHAPFIELDSRDISTLAWNHQSIKNKLIASERETIEMSLLSLLGDEEVLSDMHIRNTTVCLELYAKLNSFAKQILDFTPQMFLEKVLVEFKILPFILNNEDKINLLQILNAFFEFLKTESQKNPLMDLAACIDLIDEYLKNKIPLLNSQIFGSKKGVVLSTFHGAKGLEYDNVFLLNCSDQNWNSRQRNSYKLPDTYRKAELSRDEDERRLFYVGLTRARKGVFVSFHVARDKKENVPCKYITEMLDSGFVDSKAIVLTEENLIEQLVVELSPLKKDFEAIEQALFEIFLEHFRLNPTALSKYLDCPLAFYYEKVLQIPGARTAPLGFGNAVHFALELFMKNKILLKSDNYVQIIPYFLRGMEKYKSHFTSFEFENYMEEGKKVLPDFIKFFSEEWKIAKDSELEQKFKTEITGVPISGKMDRIDIIPQGIRVVDYKTGKPDPKLKIKVPDEKNPNGSSYWQQMVFYAILLKQHSTYKNSNVNSTFYFVNQNKDAAYEKAEVNPSVEDIAFVEDLIQKTYEKISKKEFTPGCGKSTCEWCNYVNSGTIINLTDDEEDVEEDD